MPRPLLETWWDLNRDRDREPSSLLRAGIRNNPRSMTEQLIADFERAMASPEWQRRMALQRAMAPRPLSSVERATREMASPQWQQRWRQHQAFLKACGVVEQVLGTPPPVQPDAPIDPVQRQRKPGAGRHPKLTQEQIERGIAMVRDQPKMTLTGAWKRLNAAGITASRSTVYREVWKKVRGRC
jgi:hypothetical protein